MSDSHVWAPHPTLVWVPAQVLREGPTWEFKSVYDDTFEVDAKKCEQLDKVTEISLKGGLSNLVHLDEFGEGAVVHQLRDRYNDDKIYTSIGTILVAVNPFKLLPIYTAKVIEQYQKDHVNADPHVFQIAAEAYHHLLDDHRNQAVIISGESGAGKTEATKSVLQFLSEVAGSLSGVEQQILQSNPLLEAFGNAKTGRNNNSSRFGKWMEVLFEPGGRIEAAKITNYLLEKSRIVFQSEGERNYHIFYMLLEGLKPELREKFQLDPDPSTYNYLKKSGIFEIPGVSDNADFASMVTAMEMLDFTEAEMEDIYCIVATVLNIGNLEFVPGKSDGSEIADEAKLDKVAANVQLEPKTLTTGLVFRSVTVRGSVSMIPLKPELAGQSRDALAKALYGKLFDWLVRRVNITLMKDTKSELNVGILDIFGFEIFPKNYFEQVCINYTNEKLQQHFNNYIFKEEQAVYLKEGIDVSKIEFVDNIECLNLIEKKPVGIFAMFDEECCVPRGSDKALIDKMHKVFADQQKHKYYKRIRKNPDTFTIRHYAGEVTYEIEGVLAKNKDQIHDSLQMLVMKSGVKLIREIFEEKKPEEPKEESSSSSKKGRKKRSRGSRKSKKKLKTLGGKFVSQMQQLYGALSKCSPQYIRCVKPNSEKKPHLFDTAMSLRQMKYAGLFEAIRIRKSGFPFRGEYDSFAKRYRVCFVGTDLQNIKKMMADGKNKEACELIVDHFEGRLDKGEFAFGNTMIFMRNSQRVVLGQIRDEFLTVCVIKLQAFARQIAAKKIYKEMKILADACNKAMEERVIEQLQRCLTDADEKKIGLHLLKKVLIVLEYLESELRSAELLESSCKDGEASDCNVLYSALAEATVLEEKYPEEKRSEKFEAAKKKCSDLKTSLLRKEAAIKQLETATLKEDIKSLEIALKECEEINIPEEKLTAARELLKKLHYEDKVMADLKIAVDNQDIEGIKKQLELTKDIALTDERLEDVAKAKMAMHDTYDKILTDFIEKNATKELESLLPALQTMGKSYYDLVEKGESGLKDMYIKFCEACIETKDKKKLEGDLIPKIRDVLKFPTVVDKGKECLAKIYETICLEAKDAKNLDCIEENYKAIQGNGLGMDAMSLKIQEMLRKLFEVLSNEALDNEDCKQLEDVLIPKLKNYEFQSQLEKAEACLKGVYTKFCETAEKEKDTEKLEKELIPKITELKFDGVLATATNCLRKVYTEICDAAFDAKDEKKVELLLPIIDALGKTISMDQVKLHLQDCLVKLYIGLCNQALENKAAETIENLLLPKIKELSLQGAEEVAISCHKKIYLVFCEEAASQKDDGKIVDVLIPKITSLKFEDVLVSALDFLSSVYGSMIDEAKEAKDDKKIETEIMTKLSKQTSEKFAPLVKKAKLTLEHLYRGFLSEATDPSNIEDVLLPKIKELELNLLEDVNFSLEKLYGARLDKYIADSDEAKIKSEFIPKTEALKLGTLVTRANDFLGEQETARQKVVERKKQAEERTKMETAARQKAEAEEKSAQEAEEKRLAEEKKKT